MQKLFGLTTALIMTLSFVAQAAVIEQDGVFSQTNEPQEMILINSGLASLKKRLDMISEAKSTIEAEFFIYDLDDGGRLFTQALVKKALEGVKVRIMVDYSLPVFQLDKYYATELKKYGIEVKYYNKSMLLDIIGSQFRSHRKSLVIDGEQAMTGGRNIADDYFDLSPEYNFLDTDIYVKGSLAKDFQTSFDMFWNAPITREAPTVKPPQPPRASALDYDNHSAQQSYEASLAKYNKNMARAHDYVVPNAKDQMQLELVQTKGLELLQGEVSSICHDSVFAADFPGKGKKTRILYEHLAAQVLDAKHSVQIFSPYVILKKDGKSILSNLLEKGVKVELLTNSLYSTDAFYTVSAFYPRIQMWTEQGVGVYIYKGEVPAHQNMNGIPGKTARWGIHSKAAIVDNSITMVGTFNMDPRSKNLNSEMVVVCRDNQELAMGLSNEFEKRKIQSLKLGKDGRPEDGTSKFFNTKVSTRIIYHLLQPFSNLLDFLL